VRPIGGWLRRQDTFGVDIPALFSDSAAEAVRDVFGWRALDGALNVVFGSNLKLYHMSQAGAITDITPAGGSTSAKSPVINVGYGGSPYGLGAYGVSNNLAGVDPTPPLRWAFATFGELLLAVQRNDAGGTGLIYELNLVTLALSAVTNAPEHTQDIIVTQERQVFAIGVNGEPRAIAFSEVENRAVWAPAQANQAGSRTLAGDGKLLTAVQIASGVLLVGVSDAVLATYIGPPYVYRTAQVGTQCGTVAADAVVATDTFAVWLGKETFWVYDGTLQPLPCEVLDYLIEDMDKSQLSTVVGTSAHASSEIWWLYQSNDGASIDKYVSWNYVQNVWMTGSLSRTAAMDADPVASPLMITPDGVIYNHEVNGVMPDGTVFCATGPMEIGSGERVLCVGSVLPDTADVGDVSMTLYGRDMPTATEYAYGPYAYANPTSVRASGRQIRLRMDLLSSSARVGTMRLVVTPGAGR